MAQLRFPNLSCGKMKIIKVFTVYGIAQMLIRNAQLEIMTCVYHSAMKHSQNRRYTADETCSSNAGEPQG